MLLNVSENDTPELKAIAEKYGQSPVPVGKVININKPETTPEVDNTPDVDISYDYDLSDPSGMCVAPKFDNSEDETVSVYDTWFEEVSLAEIEQKNQNVFQNRNFYNDWFYNSTSMILENNQSVVPVFYPEEVEEDVEDRIDKFIK